ncbi:MAG: type II toxin-antitoxin system VapC family toxin [Candidatus Acidiferrum sp.]
MKCLLDTSVLSHSLLSQPKLNQRAMSVLRDESVELYLSVASSWEIIIKSRSGKLDLPEEPAEFLTRVLRIMSLQSLQITQLHALAVGDLPPYHRDPFDRMLIAQAREEGLVILTVDRIFEKYKVDQVYCGR